MEDSKLREAWEADPDKVWERLVTQYVTDNAGLGREIDALTIKASLYKEALEEIIDNADIPDCDCIYCKSSEGGHSVDCPVFIAIHALKQEQAEKVEPYTA